MTNPYQLPAGDPYLPPGCTNADIDRHFGTDDEEEILDTCEWCGAPCKVGETIHPECLKQERTERRRDEEKDVPHHPDYD